MKVSFIGNGQINDEDKARGWLSGILEQLVQEGADMFLFNRMGRFNEIAKERVWNLKKEYPQIQCVSVRQSSRNNSEKCYDWFVTPVQNEKIHPLLRCEFYMVEQSDAIIVSSDYNTKGEEQILEQAVRKNKKVIRYKENFESFHETVSCYAEV